MKIAALHPWDLSPSEAMALQRELAARVVRRGSVPERAVKLIAGADCAFDKPRGRAVGAVVVLAWPSLEVVEHVTVEMPVTFPYVPGLLSFRETPPLLAAFEKHRASPDLLMVDGHGYAHPRRFGFACHLGLLLDIPTIGVAKSRLIGEQGTVAGPRGSRAELTHEREVIGSMLRTRQGVRSVYVSVGHKISLDAAEGWALRCARGYRVPEPTRLADRRAGVAKRRMIEATLEIVIEQRAGEQGRWEWEKDRDEVVFRHELEPMPTHYGCSVDIMNPADGELLDVMLLDPRRPYERGQRTTVRVIDVLRRSDGDDKLLAVPVDREWPSPRTIARARKEIWDWYVWLEKPVTHWGGEEDGLRVIRECGTGEDRSVDLSSRGP
ncbi:MAG: deoxyribonuclease V [Chloroflexi bacterium]|nr:deoxyribonuclease V [Chloroflexota bacterium]